ncbi:membrane protein insertase YidC [Kiloniella laminariae]|uniref:Membrane protein insertase YidC n=1 Tax=Kiloniella laminariae TaxID=454162 RepID=A0ABT4LKI7_9PROT|nr:membrane protein insertase YidC [Kiloniella laminariae]MCZ4281601.1 membrane protein insertase YidC [Kiloniella laminariae]
MQNEDQRNILLAVVLSAVILFGWTFAQEYFFPPTPEQIAARQAAQQQQSQTQAASTGETSIPELPGSPDALPSLSAGLPREQVLATQERVVIDTPTLRGSVSLTGGRIDDLTLKNYQESIDDGSPNVTLLSPAGTAKPYYADFGWISSDRALPVPGNNTVWQASSNRLTPETPVTLTWNNGQGLTFERTLRIDKGYMINISQRVSNATNRAVDLAPYSLISRTGTPETLGYYILHEGPIGVLGGKLQEVDYSDLQEDKRVDGSTTGGWLGITDKYWLTALIPDQQQAVTTRFLYNGKNGVDRYQTDFFYAVQSVTPGQNIEFNSNFFAGAKEVPLIDKYDTELGIQDLDLAVDFGWFYYITKPFFYALHWLTGIVGNVGLSIMALTVVIKLILFPLANKSYVSMAKMRKLQPKLVALRERFGEDKQKLNQEMMTLYKQEKVNPMAGCLPIVVQIPIFFSLYKVLFVTLEMHQAPFYGWVHDLSVPDPTSLVNFFGLLPWGVPEAGSIIAFLNIGIWPVLMGITMFLQQRLNPQPTDPVQAKVFLFMPLFFTFLLGSFPAGLVIYWTWNNLLSIIQQAVIMKKAGVPLGRTPEPSKS